VSCTLRIILLNIKHAQPYFDTPTHTIRSRLQKWFLICWNKTFYRPDRHR